MTTTSSKMKRACLSNNACVGENQLIDSVCIEAAKESKQNIAKNWRRLLAHTHLNWFTFVG